MDGARDSSGRRFRFGENVLGEIFRLGRAIRLRRDCHDCFELVNWPAALSIRVDAGRRSESDRCERRRRGARRVKRDSFRERASFRRVRMIMMIMVTISVCYMLQQC